MPTVKKLAPVVWFIPTHAEADWYAAFLRLFGGHPSSFPNWDHLADKLCETTTALVADDERVRRGSELRKQSTESSNLLMKLNQQAYQLERRGSNWLKRRKAATLRKQAILLQEQASDLLREGVALERQAYESLMLEPPVNKRSLVGDLCKIGLGGVDWHRFAHGSPASQREEERRRARELFEDHRCGLYSKRADRTPEPKHAQAAQEWWLLWVPEIESGATGESILASIETRVERAQAKPVRLQCDDRFGMLTGQSRDRLRGWSFGLWAFQGVIYEVKAESEGLHSEEELALLVFEAFDSERRRFERIKSKFAGSAEGSRRPRIPESVRVEVWRRDGGKCARCGRRENLEYDHIVPLSKGGSNTARNIELLCEQCNRSKGADIA